MFPRRIRSYVLREGRMTSGQQRAIDRLWPGYGLSVETGVLDYCRCFGRSAPIVLEIGFGMGDSFLEMVAAAPDRDFIGIEVHRPGVGHLLGLAESAGIENLRVYNADGVEVLTHSIPVDSVDRVQIFFPDPWHKKKHHKRRLISPTFAALVESRLKPGGVLHVATDWADYADTMVEALATTRMEPVTPPERPGTKYEQRGMRLGHDVRDLAWRKPTD